MLPFPDAPEVPEVQRATGPMPLRYEDVSQDGRMMVAPMMTSLNLAWSALLDRNPAATSVLESGVIPILVRFKIEGAPGPIGIKDPLTVHARLQLAHTVGRDEKVDRLLLNMWTRLEAPRGRTHGPPPDGAGEVIPVGRVFAEHVFTRPFAEAAERKVLRLEMPGFPEVPPDRHAWSGLDAALALPDGASPIDADWVVDGTVLSFGLTHTDSNQHVNSLVYPKQFEDAALRRLSALGLGGNLLARKLEIGFRKPFFAGDSARVVLRTFRLGEQLGVAGAFVSDAAPHLELKKAHCFVQLLFDA